jgi:hypothetical protein
MRTDITDLLHANSNQFSDARFGDAQEMTMGNNVIIPLHDFMQS